MNGPVLVTGAAGFVGGYLVEHLARHPEASPITAWARQLPAGPAPGAVRWEAIDLSRRDLVRDALARLRPSAVYHCAGFPHASGGWADAAQAMQLNVMVTEHLIDGLRRRGSPCRVLLPGSATVYAVANTAHTEDHPVAPRTAYALSKLAQEQLGLRAIAEDGVDVIVTRSFNHTGPRQTPAFAAPSMARQIAAIERGEQEPAIRVGNLGAQRDLLDVRDVVTAYVALMKNGVPGTVYNVASGVPRSIASILEGLIARARVTVEVVPEHARMRPDDTPMLFGDASRLRAATGWAPAIPFEQTLDDLLDYWRDDSRLR